MMNGLYAERLDKAAMQIITSWPPLPVRDQVWPLFGTMLNAYNRPGAVIANA